MVGNMACVVLPSHVGGAPPSTTIRLRLNNGHGILMPNSDKTSTLVDPALLRRIFRFLESNTCWNHEFQNYEFRRSLAYCAGRPNPKRARLEELLRGTAATQSKPSMRLLRPFWVSFHKLDASGVSSMEAFTTELERIHGRTTTATGPWHRLYSALSAHGGWGPKTSALFVRNVIKIHRGESSLHFWSDAKKRSASPFSEDCVYLPVDRVIENLFGMLGMKSPGFDKVNALLHWTFEADEMLIWDDLWFWGFFTQFVEKAPTAAGDSRRANPRSMRWNSDKFWCKVATPKESEAELTELGKQFIKLFRDPRAR